MRFEFSGAILANTAFRFKEKYTNAIVKLPEDTQFKPKNAF